LGPSGMRGRMFVKDHYTDKARQILVTKIDAGSPAYGTMEVGDVILGVAGKLFSDLSRRLHSLGRAKSRGSDQGRIEWCNLHQFGLSDACSL
ncbi:MAG: DUF6288 domain-containing protein, partial [Verrucomicrobiaceae bacterium]